MIEFPWQLADIAYKRRAAYTPSGGQVKVAMELAEMIRELREKTGMTQVDLAKKAGLSLRTVQGWEQGRRAPVSADFFRLVKALGVSADLFAETTIDKRKTPKRKSKK